MKLKTLLKLALREDSYNNDITTKYIVDEKCIICAKIISKSDGIICGVGIAKMIFHLVDRKISFSQKIDDGQRIKKGDIIAELKGPAASILSAERTALNFLQHLSGIATLTGKYVNAAGRKVKIYDTRKTTPLLRKLEKYAVRCGGGMNHRLNLSDMVLIKDNHLKIVKNLDARLKKLKAQKSKKKIEIEANRFEQVKRFVPLAPDIIMLDNMNIKTLKKSINFIRKNSNCEIEISGGVSLKNIKDFAKLNPDRISVGAITHSASALDISLEIVS